MAVLKSLAKAPEPADVHTRFAAKYFNCCLWEVTPAMRKEYKRELYKWLYSRNADDADIIMADTDAADKLGVL